MAMAMVVHSSLDDVDVRMYFVCDVVLRVEGEHKEGVNVNEGGGVCSVLGRSIKSCGASFLFFWEWLDAYLCGWRV